MDPLFRFPFSRLVNLPTNIIPTKICWLKMSVKFPADMRIPPLKLKILFQSKPLKSRILVRRLAVQPILIPMSIMERERESETKARENDNQDTTDSIIQTHNVTWYNIIWYTITSHVLSITNNVWSGHREETKAREGVRGAPHEAQGGPAWFKYR